MKAKMSSSNHKKTGKETNLRSGLYFLGSSIILMLVLYLINSNKTKVALHYSLILLIRLIPLIAVILTFSGLLTYFIKPKSFAKYFGKESGVRGLSIAIVAGIIVHGPIYVWFPMLKDFRDHGMKTSLIAVFLYNRAIKIPLIPLLIYYFGITYTLALLAMMIVASVILGFCINLVMRE